MKRIILSLILVFSLLAFTSKAKAQTQPMPPGLEGYVDYASDYPVHDFSLWLFPDDGPQPYDRAAYFRIKTSGYYGFYYRYYFGIIPANALFSEVIFPLVWPDLHHYALDWAVFSWGAMQ